MQLKLTEYLNSRPIIALVGATNDSSKYGNIIFRDMVRKNFDIVPINHKAKSVNGIPAFPDLISAANQKKIGLIVYVIPPSLTLKSLEEANSLGLKKVWIQPGAGDEQVREFLENNQFEFLMDACVMVESA